MHVLIIPSEEFLPGGSITIGIFQYHQAKVLSEAGHTVGVISVRQSFSYPMIAKGLFCKLFGKRTNNACDDLSFKNLLKLGYRKSAALHKFISMEAVKGVNVLRIDGFYYWPPVENKNHKGWIKAGLVAYKAYVEKHGPPELIHAHNAIYAGMLAKEIFRKHKVPYVLTEHSTVYARGTIKDSKIIGRVEDAYNHAAVLTAVSRPFCNLLNAAFSLHRFECLHNVLDPDYENCTRAQRGTQENFTFVNIAELHPKKDHELLIRAFKVVYEKYPHVRLQIGGDGDLRDDLRRLTQQLNLQQAVLFLGALKRSEVFDVLSKADCFVLTSKYETFGVVVIEAMLVGKPVIVTRCGGPESFVTAESGVIVEKENTSQLGEAMLRMIHNGGQFDARRIRQSAVENFGAAAFVRNVTNFYRQATQTTGSPPSASKSRKQIVA